MFLGQSTLDTFFCVSFLGFHGKVTIHNTTHISLAADAAVFTLVHTTLTLFYPPA